MRKKMQNKWIVIIIALTVLFHGGIIETQAAGERVYFGSANYEWALDSASPIGIYAGADQNIASAELYIRYDGAMMEYSSGGESVEPGLVRVYGEGIAATEYMQMLEFIPRMAGTTQITVERGTVVNETGESIEVAPATVTVTISPAEGSTLDSIQVNGNPIQGFNPMTTEYRMETAADAEQAQISALPAERQVEISDTTLKTGENVIQIIASNDTGNRTRYTLHITKPEAAVQTPAEKPAQQTQTEPVVITEKEETTADFNFLLMIGIVVLLILLVVLAAVLYLREKKRKEELRKQRLRKRKQQKKKRQTQMQSIKEAATVLEKTESETKGQEAENKETEISVRNVTMEFKREKDESTSIKELLIRTLKGQRSYEMFRALDDVSFDIYKGEVVGIIGTNGSGKSTILKIISGALSPTKGKVEVDKSKIQLLTLGTGFDFELTGRENVYLNGAIIGYTKEYIDEKYEDIVKFAELEGFMEEKVRNYSSGMVSRLGFAIATIRDTPEILILDEVLSVGDMFFRQKSENRIKEMMNGGSTVLIVSHSTSVIRNNCTKAVWIEKGILRAVGDPKEVCDAYEKMNEAAQ